MCIEKIRKIELEMFGLFIEICQKYNLRYYLLGGTLLGAVRHKGFIPWDDDIDVGMPREDYEKFISVAQDNLPPHLFVQTHKTDPQYPICYCKIRNSNTTFIETSVKNLNINHGMFIDVFPLDNYPSDRKEQKKFAFKKRIYNIIISNKYYVINQKFIVRMKRICGRVASLVMPTKKAIQKREKLYTSQTNKTIWANNGGAWGEKEICPAEWYGDGIDLTFEGITVKAPQKYELWLTQVYGDYMKLPPEEKRVSHHYTEVIDSEQSYTEYIKFKRKI